MNKKLTGILVVVAAASGCSRLGETTGVATGHWSTYAIQSDYSMHSWGGNNEGQLGQASSDTEFQEPQQVVKPADKKWKQVAVGYQHAVALDAERYFYGTGDASEGAIGPASSTIQIKFKRIGKPRWASISAASSYTLAIGLNGKLFGGGEDTAGELDLFKPGFRDFPTQLFPYADDWVWVSAGERHAVGSREDGTLSAWGHGWHAKFGEELPSPDDNDLWIVSADKDWDLRNFSAGGNHTIALKKDGTAWGWGYNDAGQLCTDVVNPAVFNGDDIIQKPTQIPGLGSDDGWIMVAAGRDHSLFLNDQGYVYSCGDNSYGQLGRTTTPHELKAVQVLTDAVWIDAGSYYSAAVDKSGRVWTWGRDWQGALGNGSNADDEAEPVRIAF